MFDTNTTPNYYVLTHIHWGAVLVLGVVVLVMMLLVIGFLYFLSRFAESQSTQQAPTSHTLVKNDTATWVTPFQDGSTTKTGV